MNTKHINLELNNSHLTINLLLYRTVKEIIQSKISNVHILKLIEHIKLLTSSQESFEVKKNILLDFTQSLSNSENVKNRLFELVEHSILEEIHFNVFKLSLNILRFKDYILEKSKLYADNFKTCDDVHIMDFQYDQNMLNLPYAMRVSGALLIKILFIDINKNKDNFYNSLISDIQKIKEIDPETILQIIFAESASQSIRSLSGSGYEERFETLLKANNLTYQGQCFDNNIRAVEYDFKISLENEKKIGVSVKRTLRERYKQNHENIVDLEVDAMIIVTLGVDLNKAKVDYILEKEKHYIFVATDLYNQIDYLKNNDKVFSLTNLNKMLLTEISK